MITNNKFKNIPTENDTTILLSSEMNLGKYEITYQKWFWDGVQAESIIFYNEDIKHLSKEEIVKEVKKSPIVKSNSKITYSKDDAYTFVNFNFNTQENKTTN